jgi:hypothetical protein
MIEAQLKELTKTPKTIDGNADLSFHEICYCSKLKFGHTWYSMKEIEVGMQMFEKVRAAEELKKIIEDIK